MADFFLFVNSTLILMQKSPNHAGLPNNLRKLLSQTLFFSLNHTTKFKWNFLKKSCTGNCKNLHAMSKLSLPSETEKTCLFFIDEVQPLIFLAMNFV